MHVDTLDYQSEHELISLPQDMKEFREDQEYIVLQAYSINNLADGVYTRCDDTGETHKKIFHDGKRNGEGPLVFFTVYNVHGNIVHSAQHIYNISMPSEDDYTRKCALLWYLCNRFEKDFSCFAESVTVPEQYAHPEIARKNWILKERGLQHDHYFVLGHYDGYSQPFSKIHTQQIIDPAKYLVLEQFFVDYSLPPAKNLYVFDTYEMQGGQVFGDILMCRDIYDDPFASQIVLVNQLFRSTLEHLGLCTDDGYTKKVTIAPYGAHRESLYEELCSNAASIWHAVHIEKDITNMYMFDECTKSGLQRSFYENIGRPIDWSDNSYGLSCEFARHMFETHASPNLLVAYQQLIATYVEKYNEIYNHRTWTVIKKVLADEIRHDPTEDAYAIDYYVQKLYEVSSYDREQQRAFVARYISGKLSDALYTTIIPAFLAELQADYKNQLSMASDYCAIARKWLDTYR